MEPATRPTGLLWSDEPIHDVGAWAHATQALLNLEAAEEQSELGDLLSKLNPAEAQAAGLSLLNLRHLGKGPALFGRTKYTVRAGV